MAARRPARRRTRRRTTRKGMVRRTARRAYTPTRRRRRRNPSTQANNLMMGGAAAAAAGAGVHFLAKSEIAGKIDPKLYNGALIAAGLAGGYLLRKNGAVGGAVLGAGVALGVKGLLDVMRGAAPPVSAIPYYAQQAYPQPSASYYHTPAGLGAVGTELGAIGTELGDLGAVEAQLAGYDLQLA